jgi:hypothetical protein
MKITTLRAVVQLGVSLSKCVWEYDLINTRALFHVQVFDEKRKKNIKKCIIKIGIISES